MKKVAVFIVLLSFCTLISAQNVFRTACNGQLKRLDSLLAYTTITVKDNRGRSLLHWAVACKQKEVFDLLVKKGFGINTPDNLGATPMHMAVRYNSDYHFNKLKQLQRDADWKATLGPLLFEPAILTRNKRFIKKLVENGIDINSTNNRGSTPLEIALRIGADEITQQLLNLGADRNKVRNMVAEGLYMGQQEPGTSPKIFAPNFISTEEYEFGSVFNSAGDEFYYGVDVNGKSEIRYSKLEHGNWTKPIIILSHEQYGYNDPFLSPDEQRLYFISKRALNGDHEQKKDYDIWFVMRTESGWSQPVNVGPNVNTESDEYYSSFTKEGTLYFASDKKKPDKAHQNDHDIYYSTLSDGTFQKAVRLDASINTEAYEADVFVDPDEQYLIFCSIRDEGFGRGDLYISFKNSDGTWGKARNMGEKINTVGHELCPFVTNDGKYLFFTSKEDIYWVSTAIFDELKKAKQ